MADCLHYKFESSVNVFRLTNNEFTNAEPTGFSAEIKVRCADCKQEFEFIGLPMGMSTMQPMVSADGREARLPIKPA